MRPLVISSRFWSGSVAGINPAIAIVAGEVAGWVAPGKLGGAAAEGAGAGGGGGVAGDSWVIGWDWSVEGAEGHPPSSKATLPTDNKRGNFFMLE
jgi:hypothetical protein